ncbi:MAG: CbiX/SirB N-terminal domain-containing protein [Proteobacteria bacterium]|nr:cobalamin biosynthesis protein CbiX [Pseudomonadota bacterium]NOG60802.1 CbiX/SirB N-terminal domain-containing protein [Pseudomonadota bacterium]
MKTLIIIAHGSRREESNIEVKELTEKVKGLADSEYDYIAHAYLEMAEPSLTQAIDNCINNGAKNITVFPYFLNSGKHLKRDIPEIIIASEKKYPDCIFRVTACIGMIEDMPRLILEQARSN